MYKKILKKIDELFLLNFKEKELQKYVALINNRPRERLNFLTPNEVFNNKTKSCIWL